MEYINKLIRQYHPKNEVINEYNEKNINKIQIKLNRRPRKELGYEMPINIFAKFVA